jgi:putative membrane protein
MDARIASDLPSPASFPPAANYIPFEFRISIFEFIRGLLAPGGFMRKMKGMRPFLIRWLVTTASVWVAAPIAGLHYDSAASLIGAALVLGIINAIVRPVVLLLSLPFIIVTLGLGILIVNALLLMVVPHLVRGFHVGSFGHAFFGAIIISVVSWILSAFIRSEGGRTRIRVISREDGIKQAKGRVIE